MLVLGARTADKLISNLLLNVRQRDKRWTPGMLINCMKYWGFGSKFKKRDIFHNASANSSPHMYPVLSCAVVPEVLKASGSSCD